MKVSYIALLLGFAVAGAGAIYINSNQAKMSGHSNDTGDLSKLQPGDPIVSVKVPATLSPQAELGKTAFNAICAACHGENAAGVYGAGPPFINRIYVPNHHSDYAFWAATQNGVVSHHWPFGNMPPQKGLTKADVANIVAYVRALQAANGIK